MLTTKESHNKKETIPVRKGIRPKTIRGPLHIQCDGSGDGGRFRELIAESYEFARTSLEVRQALAKHNCWRES